jgi:hypothetical protein
MKVKRIAGKKRRNPFYFVYKLFCAMKDNERRGLMKFTPIHWKIGLLRHLEDTGEIILYCPR